jgi:hypothetical protein
MKTFEMVNPLIIGLENYSATYNAKTDMEAAEKAWKGLTNNVVGHSTRFLFSMREMKGGAIRHYEVNENKKEQSYTITPFEATIKAEYFNKFRENVNEHLEGTNIDGGKHSSDSSSDSSSSSSSKFKVKSRPRRRRHSSTSSSDQYPTIRQRYITPIFNYSPSLYTSTTYNSTLNPQVVVAPIAIPQLVVSSNPVGNTVQLLVFNP